MKTVTFSFVFVSVCFRNKSKLQCQKETVSCLFIYVPVTTSPIWPAGAYSFLSPVDGCPGSYVFRKGWWQHWGRGYNRQSSEVNLAGEFTRQSFRYEFCVKNDLVNVTGAPSWETGGYCILRVGGQCPDGEVPLGLPPPPSPFLSPHLSPSPSPSFTSPSHSLSFSLTHTHALYHR